MKTFVIAERCRTLEQLSCPPGPGHCRLHSHILRWCTATLNTWALPFNNQACWNYKRRGRSAQTDLVRCLLDEWTSISLLLNSFSSFRIAACRPTRARTKVSSGVTLESPRWCRLCLLHWHLKQRKFHFQNSQLAHDGSSRFLMTIPTENVNKSKFTKQKGHRWVGGGHRATLSAADSLVQGLSARLS